MCLRVLTLWRVEAEGNEAVEVTVQALHLDMCARGSACVVLAHIVCVCVCACMCVCVRACVRAWACVHVCVSSIAAHTPVYVHMHACIYGRSPWY